MNTMDCHLRPHRAGAALLLALLLAACGRPRTPGEETPAPVTPPPQAAAVPVPTEKTPVVTTTAAKPTQSVAASAPVPAPAAAPAAAAQPAAAAEPALAAMRLATPSSKLGVPVDLRYQFDGATGEGQTATLHLAAVPRVEGSNLAVTIKDVPGIHTSVGEIRAAKASVATPYRRQLAVTRERGGPTELRVLVTMDMPEGQAFSWFSVPLDSAPPAAGKQPLVRME